MAEQKIDVMKQLAEGLGCKFSDKDPNPDKCQAPIREYDGQYCIITQCSEDPVQDGYGPIHLQQQQDGFFPGIYSKHINDPDNVPTEYEFSKQMYGAIHEKYYQNLKKFRLKASYILASLKEEQKEKIKEIDKLQNKLFQVYKKLDEQQKLLDSYQRGTPEAKSENIRIQDVESKIEELTNEITTLQTQFNEAEKKNIELKKQINQCGSTIGQMGLLVSEAYKKLSESFNMESKTERKVQEASELKKQIKDTLNSELIAKQTGLFVIVRVRCMSRPQNIELKESLQFIRKEEENDKPEINEIKYTNLNDGNQNEELEIPKSFNKKYNFYQDNGTGKCNELLRLGNPEQARKDIIKKLNEEINVIVENYEDVKNNALTGTNVRLKKTGMALITYKESKKKEERLKFAQLQQTFYKYRETELDLYLQSQKLKTDSDIKYEFDKTFGEWSTNMFNKANYPPRNNFTTETAKLWNTDMLNLKEIETNIIQQDTSLYATGDEFVDKSNLQFISRQDPNDLQDAITVIGVGGSGSGKTTATKALIRYILFVYLTRFYTFVNTCKKIRLKAIEIGVQNKKIFRKPLFDNVFEENKESEETKESQKLEKLYPHIHVVNPNRVKTQIGKSEFIICENNKEENKSCKICNEDDCSKGYNNTSAFEILSALIKFDTDTQKNRDTTYTLLNNGGSSRTIKVITLSFEDGTLNNKDKTVAINLIDTAGYENYDGQRQLLEAYYVDLIQKAYGTDQEYKQALNDKWITKNNALPNNIAELEAFPKYEILRSMEKSKTQTELEASPDYKNTKNSVNSFQRDITKAINERFSLLEAKQLTQEVIDESKFINNSLEYLEKVLSMYNYLQQTLNRLVEFKNSEEKVEQDFVAKYSKIPTYYYQALDLIEQKDVDERVSSDPDDKKWMVDFLPQKSCTIVLTTFKPYITAQGDGEAAKNTIVFLKDMLDTSQVEGLYELNSLKFK